MFYNRKAVRKGSAACASGGSLVMSSESGALASSPGIFPTYGSTILGIDSSTFGWPCQYPWGTFCRFFSLATGRLPLARPTWRSADEVPALCLPIGAAQGAAGAAGNVMIRGWAGGSGYQRAPSAHSSLRGRPAPGPGCCGGGFTPYRAAPRRRLTWGLCEKWHGLCETWHRSLDKPARGALYCPRSECSARNTHYRSTAGGVVSSRRLPPRLPSAKGSGS